MNLYLSVMKKVAVENHNSFKLAIALYEEGKKFSHRR